MTRPTTERRELRDLIKRLAALIKTERAADRVTAKARRAAAKAEALANKPPPLSRAHSRLNQLQTTVTRFEAVLAAGPPQRISPGMPGAPEATQANLEYMKAQGGLPGARVALAAHVRNHTSLRQADDLLPWALKYLAEWEGAFAPVPH